MNTERIRELLEKAREQTKRNVSPSVFAEKFANLIVRECVEIIEAQDVDPSFKLRMSWAVKQHFGVEE